MPRFALERYPGPMGWVALGREAGSAQPCLQPNACSLANHFLSLGLGLLIHKTREYSLS